MIAGYHRKFLTALKQVPKAETPAEVEKELPGLPEEPAMPNPDDVVDGEIKRRGEARREERRRS
jgi:hypothetical protein